MRSVAIAPLVWPSSRARHGSGFGGALAVLPAAVILMACLVACAARRPATPSHPEAVAPTQRKALEVTLERVEDSPGVRAKYPFLGGPFDQARSFSQEFPDAVPTEIHIADLDRRSSGASMDLIFMELPGTYNCGTLGCASAIYGRRADGSYENLVGFYTHPNAGIYWLRCGDALSLLLSSGHGMEVGWAEWRWTGQDFQELKFYSGTDLLSSEQGAPYPDLSRLPPCPAGPSQ